MESNIEDGYAQVFHNDMLNSNLPQGQLHQELSNYLDKIDFILHELGMGGHIVQDKSIMGLLHHALNIPRYANPSFREELLRLCRTQ